MKLAIVSMAAVTLIVQTGISAPTACAAPVDVNIQLNGYLPAPPGVRIYFDSGRPYYVENHRRVYVEKKRKHDNGKHKGEGHGRKNGHGKGHGHH
ncbi:MAG TPA: hypothetical protein DCZ75_14085 [Geobacter sp.]|nr:hypothetical protein [Geobacter sp.]